MEPTPLTLQFLFNGTLHYQVPKYQRPYEWGLDRFLELWEDVGVLYRARDDSVEKSARVHFMGVLIIERLQHNGPGSSIANNVIDGQQRLVTLLILLAAIRDHHSADSTVQVRCRQVLCFEGADGKAYQRLSAQKTDAAALESCLSGAWKDKVPDSSLSSSVSTAYRYFRLQLHKGIDTLKAAPSDLPKLPKTSKKLLAQARGAIPHESWGAVGTSVDAVHLVEIVTQQLSVLQIVLHPQDEDAAVVFQAINGRRTELTQFDHVRNSVFVFLGSDAPDVYEGRWREMEKRLEDAKLPNAKKSPGELFLETYLISRGNRVTAKALHSGFLEVVRRLSPAALPPAERQARVLSLVRELSESSELYRVLVGKPQPLETDGGLPLQLSRRSIESLAEIRAFSAGPPFPLILWLLRHWRRTGDHGELEQRLCDVASFLGRRSIGGLAQSPLRSFFTDLVIGMVQAEREHSAEEEANYQDSYRAAVTVMMTRLTDSKPGCPDDVDVRDALLDNELYGRLKPHQVFMILRAAELQLRQQEPPILLFGQEGGYSIEHVFPQNHNKPEMPKSWQSDAKTWELSPKQVADLLSCRHRVGNLTLTMFNQTLGTKSYAAKRQLLQDNSGLAVHGDIVKQETSRWSATEIDGRARWLATHITAYWPKPERPSEADSA